MTTFREVHWESVGWAINLSRNRSNFRGSTKMEETIDLEMRGFRNIRNNGNAWFCTDIRRQRDARAIINLPAAAQTEQIQSKTDQKLLCDTCRSLIGPIKLRHVLANQAPACIGQSSSGLYWPKSMHGFPNTKNNFVLTWSPRWRMCPWMQNSSFSIQSSSFSIQNSSF